MFGFSSKKGNQFYSYVSNFNSLCYDIEPRVNKEKEKISFNLLEDMLTLFTTVQSFSYAKDIKEKHKIKSNKSKKLIIMKRNQEMQPQQRYGLLNASQSQLQSQAMILNICQNSYFYSHPF